MFNLSENYDQVVYTVIVATIIFLIVFMLIRASRRKELKPWPAIFVGLYNILLLLLYLLGMTTQISWEGFGFLPLLALTLPWSWLLEWLISSFAGAGPLHSFSGSSFEATLFINFVICNAMAGSANSLMLYFLLKRRQTKRERAKAAVQVGDPGLKAQ